MLLSYDPDMINKLSNNIKSYTFLYYTKIYFKNQV